MRILYCPPLSLLWSFLPGDGSPASFLHKFYARAVWRERGVLARLRLLGALLVSPVVAVGMMAWVTWLNGAAIKSRTGRGSFGRSASSSTSWWRTTCCRPGTTSSSCSRTGSAAVRETTCIGSRPKAVSSGFSSGHRVRIAHRSATSFSSPLGAANTVFRAFRFFSSRRTAELRGPCLQGGDATPRLPEVDLFVKPLGGRGGFGAESWRIESRRTVQRRQRPPSGHGAARTTSGGDHSSSAASCSRVW